MWKIMMVFGMNMVAALAGIPSHAATEAHQQPSVAEVADQEKVAGSVKTLKGEAFIVRDGRRAVPEVGTRLHAQDVIHTGKNGAMGIILRDDTSLSIGPSSELALKAFVFRPKEGLFSSVTRIVRGTLVYITGRIAKLAPGSVTVETPVGVVAVRGTKILVQVD